jgi:hypothetical protein
VRFALARGFALAGALVVAGTQTAPCDEVASRRKAAHVAADFRQDGDGGQGADAGDRAQKGDQGPKRGLPDRNLLVHLGHRRSDLAIDPLDGRAQGVVLADMELEQEAMMIGQPPMERVVELFRRGLDLPVGQRQLARIAHPRRSSPRSSAGRSPPSPRR